MLNPFDQFDTAPVPIMGAAKPVDPYKAEDQQMQREAADRAERAALRADGTAKRLAAAAERTAEAAVKPTEFQSKSAGFLGRMMQAEQNFGSVPEGERGGRGLVRQKFHDIAPGVENTWINSDDRQKADQAVENFIAASLRQESGAAISPQEFTRQYKIFFPAPGDGPELLAQKADARRQAIEGFKIAAGPLADSAAGTVQDGDLSAFNKGMNDIVGDRRKSPEQRLADAMAFAAQSRRGVDPEQITAAIAAGHGNVVEDPNFTPPGAPSGPAAPPSGPIDGLSIPAQIGESTANAVAAFGQGAATLADIPATAMGAVLGKGAEFLGFDNVARDLRNPTTIGGLIEQAIPTPKDPVGRGVRLVGQLGGGVVAFPQRAANALASNIGGHVPPGFTGGGPARGLAAEGREVIEAGARQRVPIRQPDARPAVRGDFAAAAQSPTGGPRIGNALAADRGVVGQRVSEVAEGQARDPYALGNQVQGAMNRQKTRMKTEADALFKRVERAAPDHTADPAPVLSAIDDKISSLSAEGATANAAEIKVLEGIKSDFAQSGISVKSLQTQRRGMRQRLKDNGIDVSSADASYMNILGTAGKTLESSLAANPKALGSLKSANAKWAEGAAFRQEIAKQFMGSRNAPLKPETAASRFISMTKQGGDYNRFSRGFQELERSERDDFAATIAEGMGKVKSGEFSYGQFVKDLEGMNPRAVRDLFGTRGQEALNDLRVIAKAKSDTAGAMNHSNTGGVMARTNGFRDLVMTAFGGGVAGVPGAIAGALSRSALERFSSARQARMLLDPTFTKWLKRMPNSTNPKVIDQHFARLTSVAANSPALAADAKALQAFLTEALEQSPGRLAAAQDETNGRREPPQAR